MCSLELAARPATLIRYIFIDLDDTLRPAPGVLVGGYLHHIYVPIFGEIVARSKRGEIPRMGLCTGRELPYVEGYTESWGATDIINGGAETVNRLTGMREYHSVIDDNVRELFRLLRREAFPAILPSIRGLFLYEGRKEITLAIQSTNTNVPIQDYIPVIEDHLDRYVDGAKEPLATYKQFVEVDYSNSAIDYRPRGVNKGTAFEIFCARQNIDPQQVLSIGDSRGDFPIMQRAGYIACPSKASAECKDLVDSRGEKGHISPYMYLEGVIDILKHFLGDALNDL